jgi:competence protein ComEA
LATTVLLALTTLLLLVHTYGPLRRGARPTTLDRVGCASQIDLNHADRGELLQLPGVGEALSRRILDYRREHNGFRCVEDLRKVHGIGSVTLERLRPLVCVTDREESDEESDTLVLPASLRASVPSTRQALQRSPTTTDKKANPTAQLDINRAALDELRQLPGIGPALAQRIVEAREQQPFQSVDDLRRVRGIGAKTLEKVRPFVIVGKTEDSRGRANEMLQAQVNRDDDGLRED